VKASRNSGEQPSPRPRRERSQQPIQRRRRLSASARVPPGKGLQSVADGQADFCMAKTQRLLGLSCGWGTGNLPQRGY